MTLRSILVPASSKLDLEGPLDAALALARPLQAHIDVLYIAPPTPVIEEYVPHPSPSDMTLIEQKIQDEIAREETLFQNWCGANRVDLKPEGRLLGSTFARWQAIESEIERAIAHAGRLSDLIVVNRPKIGDIQASRCFDAAVFSAGRPTLLTPPRKIEQPLRHILIAWNGSLEAMRAVALSLDLIHSAERVSIFSAKSERNPADAGAELASALRWHGIDAGALQAKGKGAAVGESLLSCAEEANVSLIVMGAFTHSRVREALLGGVTRHILSRSELPVIMTH